MRVGKVMRGVIFIQDHICHQPGSSVYALK